MEKGFKTLQTLARTAQRRAVPDISTSYHGQGIPDPEDDSGISLGSFAEMEVDQEHGSHQSTEKASSWHAGSSTQQTHHQDHVRSRSLPQLLPLYQPPAPPINAWRRAFDGPMTTSPATTSPATLSFSRPTQFSRYSPDNGRGGISIPSVLSPADPQMS